jgi:uncharacterized protein YdaU (DUF1376 family)
LNFYRRFPGDYARDTKHLTLAEHGVYTLLLDYYYSTERPIPSIEFAFALCNAHQPRTRKAVRQVLKNFFKKSLGGYKNKRVEEEMRHLNSRRQSAKNSAKTRWNACERISERNANAVRTQCKRSTTSHAFGNAIQTPDSRLHKLQKRLKSSTNGLDDLKKAYLDKCTDPRGEIAAIVEIICNRAELSGTRIQTEAYIAKAVETFDIHGGQDLEELQQFLRKVPN